MQGAASRRGADQLIALGRVAINGEIVTEPFFRVDPLKDRIMIDGKPLGERGPPLFIMLNKPVGYTCSHRRFGQDKLVYDLLPKEYGRLFSIGRLDRDSRGLLLLTNDGDLSHTIIHPSQKIEKEYVVTTHEKIPPETVAFLKKGVLIEETLCKAVKISILSPYKAQVVIMEGKKRQLRLMFQAAGLTVKDLLRIRIGSFLLSDLKDGHYTLIPSPLSTNCAWA